MAAAVHLVGVLEQLLQRLGPRHLVEQLHALVVLDAVGLHLADRLAARLVLLRAEHRPRVLERGLDDGHHVEGVRRLLRVEHVEDPEGVRRQRLVQREPELQVLDEPVGAAVLARRVDPLDHAGGEQRPQLRDRPTDQPHLRAGVLVVVAQQPPHRRERVALAGDHVEQHRVADPHPGHQRLGLGRDQPVEGVLGPVHLPLGRLLALHPLELLGVVAGLLHQPVVLDGVVRRLHDDGPGGVEAGAPGPSRDLVELPRLEQPLPATVVLREAGEHHGADRDVDADAEGVGAADDLEQPGLGELLDEPAVLRQHAGVVHADAVPHQPRQRLAEAGAEPEAADQLRDPVALLARADVDAGERLRALQRGGLGEVHDVHRRLVGLEQLLERLVQRRQRPLVGQRHRTARAS